MIKGVIFDLDGVVVDSPKIYFKVMKSFFKKQNIEITETEIKKLLGCSLKEKYKEIVSNHTLKISLDEFFSQILNESMELAKTELKLNKGVKKLLRDLKENDFSIGLASNNTKKTIDFFLKKFDVKKFFSATISVEEVLKEKPDPEIYKKIVKKLMLSLEECIGIEDTLIGVRSVKNAGLKCIAYPNKYTSTETFKEADLVIKDFSELSFQKISGM